MRKQLSWWGFTRQPSLMPRQRSRPLSIKIVTSTLKWGLLTSLIKCPRIYRRKRVASTIMCLRVGMGHSQPAILLWPLQPMTLEGYLKEQQSHKAQQRRTRNLAWLSKNSFSPSIWRVRWRSSRPPTWRKWTASCCRQVSPTATYQQSAMSLSKGPHKHLRMSSRFQSPTRTWGSSSTTSFRSLKSRVTLLRTR